MRLTKRQLKRIIREEKQRLDEMLGTDDQTAETAGVVQACRESFEFDTLVKVQDVILEAYPDGNIDSGAIAEMHSAQLSNGLVLDFEQLSDLVCEWMVNYAQACTEQQ